ncbi:MAG: DNA polymerase III subunit beta, partial [Candidatus Sumerlaeia bacterium]|nr:DNA polymerase III subunit beta [Candidatus Sumerlaeia bacterium]
ADVAEAGSLTVPAAKLMEIVRVVPQDNIYLEQEENRLKIQCLSNTYRLSIMPAEEFPQWSPVEPVTSFSITQKALKKIIATILFAIPQREPRRVLLGGLFRIRNGKLVCVGTDGKKLGHITTEISNLEGEPENEAIVPHKVLLELSRVLTAEGECLVSFGERQVSFDLGNVKIISSKIEGKYPPYESIIPQKAAYIVKASKDALLDAIKRAAIISEEKTNAIIFKFQNERALLTAMSYDLGSYEGILPVDYKGKEFDIAFNHKFLQEIIRAIDSDVVEIKVQSTEEPVIIVGTGEENAFFLIMPITIVESVEPKVDEVQEDEAETEDSSPEEDETS